MQGEIHRQVGMYKYVQGALGIKEAATDWHSSAVAYSRTRNISTRNTDDAQHPASNRDSSGEIIMFMFGVEPTATAILTPNVTNFMRSSRVQWQLYLLGAISNRAHLANQGMLLSTRTPTLSRCAAPPRPTPIPVLVGSYGSERTQPSFPRWRRGPETSNRNPEVRCIKGRNL